LSLSLTSLSPFTTVTHCLLTFHLFPYTTLFRSTFLLEGNSNLLSGAILNVKSYQYGSENPYFTGDFQVDEDGHFELEMAIFIYRSEEHTSELQSRFDLVCRLLLEHKNNMTLSYN